MKITVLILATALVGCTQLLPARSTELGAGRYEIKAFGNMFVSDKTLYQKVEKKAQKLCGESSYGYEGTGNKEVKKERVYTNGAMQERGYLELTRVVSCQQ